MFRNPYWPFEAASKLNIKTQIPKKEKKECRKNGSQREYLPHTEYQLSKCGSILFVPSAIYAYWVSDFLFRNKLFLFFFLVFIIKIRYLEFIFFYDFFRIVVGFK